MKKKTCAILIAGLFAFSTLTRAGISQDKKNTGQDVVRISTELVQIDVVVTDKSNRSVGGLKREDFELFDNRCWATRAYRPRSAIRTLQS